MTDILPARVHLTPICNRHMRIVCISGTHGFHRKLDVPEADVLIHAGDFSSLGGKVEDIDDFNDWLASLPHKYKVVVAGNHDKLFESNRN